MRESHLVPVEVVVEFAGLRPREIQLFNLLESWRRRAKSKSPGDLSRNEESGYDLSFLAIGLQLQGIQTLLPIKGKLFFSWQGVGQQTSPRHPVYCGTDLLLGP